MFKSVFGNLNTSRVNLRPFEEYAPPVTIYYAHLAHAIGDTDSAETCYHIAANLDSVGPVGSNVPQVDL